MSRSFSPALLRAVSDVPGPRVESGRDVCDLDDGVREDQTDTD